MYVRVARVVLLMLMAAVLIISFFSASLGLNSDQTVMALKWITYPALGLLAFVAVLEPLAWYVAGLFGRERERR